MLARGHTDTVPLLEDHGKHSDNRTLAQRSIGHKRSVVVEPDHEVTLEAAVLVVRVFLKGANSLKFPECLDLQELNADLHIIGSGAAKAR